MLFQFPPIGDLMPIIIAVCLLVVDIFILKIGLAITKAQEKTNFKWVAGSFGIQFALIFFISTPMILGGWTGLYSTEGPPIALIVLIVIFCAFIDLNVINILHKVGMMRALIIAILIIGPVTYAMYLLGSNLGSLVG
ncbi:MAG: hypothetical protein R3255_08975 [Candidatus Lokiarchaeia archaeon]|nr:hypothetical protein [Candidatus Lokiarchaeia archaeon]